MPTNYPTQLRTATPENATGQGGLPAALTLGDVFSLAVDPTPDRLYAGTDGGVYSIQQADSCIGDCDDSGDVRINELVTLVNIGLESAPPSAYPSGVLEGVAVDIALIIQAVNNGLVGCGRLS
jgi:hypothetical protein